MERINVGVVGYSGQKFDETLATRHLEHAYNAISEQFPDANVNIVSGLTDLGIPALAYRLAEDRDWGTVGIACSKAAKYDCFEVDEKLLVGNNWGDESPAFLSSIDMLVRVGGGNQSHEETQKAKDLGKTILEYDLDAF